MLAIFSYRDARNERVLISTKYGMARIKCDPDYNLQQKADSFQLVTQERHSEYGYVTGISLSKPGYTKTGWSEDLTDDNLGLWTNMYLASQAYRYKLTGDEDAWYQANRTFWALHRLYMVTPEANYGLMAKAAMPKGTLPD